MYHFYHYSHGDDLKRKNIISESLASLFCISIFCDTAFLLQFSVVKLDIGDIRTAHNFRQIRSRKKLFDFHTKQNLFRKIL